MDVGRFLRTVRWLKPVQVWGRVARLAETSRPDLRPPPVRRPQSQTWTVPVRRPPSLLGSGQITLLNETADIAGDAAWDHTGHSSALWLYNLHYFDDLTSDAALKTPAPRLTLLDRWLTENPPGRRPGWDPYPTSLRIVNWIKAALGGFPMPADAVSSLAVQARWLAGRVERHLLGNHLLANAKALVFAGAWFEGHEADGWRRLGLSIYETELAEQILPDGGHFERSPMYHALILEDLLDTLNLARAFGFEREPAVQQMLARLPAMRSWLDAMSHPDGQIGFFNDAAFDIAPEPAALAAYAERLGLASREPPTAQLLNLPSSGYFRLSTGDAVALVDAAPVGPDYLPGHAHADTLSFELSLGSQRVVVNGGVSVYGVGPDRQYERSTTAHSTVEIDGENSSEVWAGFRVGRRARVTETSASAEGDRLLVRAAHDGYRWRPGRPIHRRTWSMSAGDLIIRDEIIGSARQAIARFHFAPGVTAEIGADGCSGDLVLPGGRRMAWRTSAPAQIAPDEWRPRFGVRIPSSQLIVQLEGRSLETSFTW